jgi:hypothetical protein
MKTIIALAAASLIALTVPGLANAAFVLDTGTPTSMTMGSTLDGTDFYAAEFNLSAGATVNSIQAYIINAGLDQPGNTFTVAIYGSDLLTNRYSSQLFAGQATYSSDGWNGLSGVNFTAATAGNYWVALEIGASDSAVGLSLPQTAAGGGTAPALAFAFNSGGVYSSAGALPFGIQVDATAPVPLPAAAWLLLSGMAGLAARVRRRRTLPLRGFGS